MSNLRSAVQPVKKQERVIIHFGYPVLVEDAPIRVAKIPVNGPRLQDAVYLHPRYVPAGVEHEIVEVMGRVRGRTLDILLKEPIEYGGKPYGILNIKGSGADADERLVIRPNLWWRDQKWISVANLNERRVWGAVKRADGKSEVEDFSLEAFGVAMTPYLGINELPSSVSSFISGRYGKKTVRPLSQLPRLSQTNIRIFDLFCFPPPVIFHNYDLEEISTADANLIKAQLELAGRGKFISVTGIISDTRFIDGLFTDMENFRLRELGTYQAAFFLATVVNFWRSRFTTQEWSTYIELLEQKTGLSFKRVREYRESLLESHSDVLRNIFKDALMQVAGATLPSIRDPADYIV